MLREREFSNFNTIQEVQRRFQNLLIDLCYQVKNPHSRQDWSKIISSSCDFLHLQASNDADNDARYNLNSSTHDNKFDDALSTLIADSFSAKLTRASDKLNLMRFRLGKLAMVENDGKSAEHNLCAR